MIACGVSDSMIERCGSFDKSKLKNTLRMHSILF